jgi:hypothetical protein
MTLIRRWWLGQRWGSLFGKPAKDLSLLGVGCILTEVVILDASSLLMSILVFMLIKRLSHQG